MISTISCLVMASISLSTWAWRGPIPQAGREPVARERKAGVGGVDATDDQTGGQRAATKVAPSNAGAPAVTGPPLKTSASSPAGGPLPAAAATGAPGARAEADRSVAAESAAAPVPSRPTELVRSPSLYETGRIGNAAVNEPGVPTTRRGEQAGPPEMLVEAKQSNRREAATPASYAGVVDQAILDREITPRFRLLGDCKSDVARRKRVAVSTITGTQLLLRWTILPNGRVADTQVVATAPADSRLIDCVKERMSTWSFRPAQGGAARIERKFTFR